MKHVYETTVADRFGGVLKAGKHCEDGEACALEAAAIARGCNWTDDPARVGLPDLRRINDSRWASDGERTEHIVPVIVALWDWPRWTTARRIAWAKEVALRTIREVLPIVLELRGFNDEAAACRAATDLVLARAAASAAMQKTAADAAAAAAADAAAAYAAYAAADAAAAAADAYAYDGDAYAADAYADAYAAAAAYAAAYAAAADAADAARTRVLRECAALVRERLPWAMIEAAVTAKATP